MRVLFILHGPFDCQSGVQIHHFARGLKAHGWDSAVLSQHNPESVENIGEPAFEPLNFSGLEAAIARWGGPPDICHAWSPREVARLHTRHLKMVHDVPFTIHLEDPEMVMLSRQLERERDQLEADPPEELIDLSMFHPIRGRRFLDAASGHTYITESLRPQRYRRPQLLLHPCLDAERFAGDAMRQTIRHRYGILDHEYIVGYAGNIHASNRVDMFSLYLSIALLRRRGHPVRLLRMGGDWAPSIDESGPALLSNVIQLGSVAWSNIPTLLQACDAFVQPGAPDEFNRNRLPAKIPEFLATGKPTLLPRCNIALRMEDGREAILMDRGDAQEIADGIERLIGDPDLGARIGAEGQRFAAGTFEPEAICAGLDAHYREVIGANDELESGRSRTLIAGPPEERVGAGRRPLHRRAVGRIRRATSASPAQPRRTSA